MKSEDLIKSIIKNAKPLETRDLDGKLISIQRSGWMSKKQAEFLISLMEKEGYNEHFGLDFWCNNVQIFKAMSNGARTWRCVERFNF